MKNKTNKERLVNIETKLEYIEKGFNNHLRHHTLYTIMALGTALAAVLSLFGGIILKLI